MVLAGRLPALLLVGMIRSSWWNASPANRWTVVVHPNIIINGAFEEQYRGCLKTGLQSGAAKVLPHSVQPVVIHDKLISIQ